MAWWIGLYTEAKRYFWQPFKACWKLSTFVPILIIVTLFITHHKKYTKLPLGRTLNILMEKLERIQHEAALAITGAWQRTSRSKIYDKSGWEILSDRRKCRCVLQIHKVINKNTHSYRKDKLPPNCRKMFSGNILFVK